MANSAPSIGGRCARRANWRLSAHGWYRRVEAHRLHPVRVQLRHRGRARRRGRPAPRQAARRQAPPLVARLRVREGAPPRPLPERPRSPDQPLRRRADGTFEAIDWDTAIREVAARLAAVRDTLRRRLDLLLRRRRPGESPPRRLRHGHAARARLALPLERARAGEDRRVLGARPHDRRRHARRLRALRGRALPRQEPVALALDPARACHAEGDLRGSGAHADRHRSAPHRDRRARRHPPRRCAPAATRVCSPRCSACSSRRTSSIAPSSTAHADGARARPGGAPRRCPSRPTARAPASTRRWCAAPRASSGGAQALSSFEDLGVQMNRDSTLVSYLHKLLVLLTGNFGKPGTHYVPTTLRRLRRPAPRSSTSPVAGAPHHRRPRAVQRDRRGDPDRSPEALPRDARRGGEPGALARRLQAHARGARARSTRSSSSTSR